MRFFVTQLAVVAGVVEKIEEAKEEREGTCK